MESRIYVPMDASILDYIKTPNLKTTLENIITMAQILGYEVSYFAPNSIFISIRSRLNTKLEYKIRTNNEQIICIEENIQHVSIKSIGSIEELLEKL